MPGPLTPQQFVAKWKGRKLTERQASHVHFTELCRMLGVPYPHENREDDANYCFDALTAAAGSYLYGRSHKAARTPSTPDLFPRDEPDPESATPAGIVSAPPGHGFADVWKRDHFCWEYKRQGKKADLAGALRQLKEYKDSLYNPPLLIVCDVDNFEIHTNFTGHPPTVYRFTLEDLADAPAEWREGRGVAPLAALRYGFTDPEWFRPKATVTDITEEYAALIGKLAGEITARKGNDPHDVAHFLMQVVFALFAEDVKLLPDDVVTKVIAANASNPIRFKAQMRDLFRTMERGGNFGLHDIDHFNGGLFQNLQTQIIPDLITTEIGLLSVIAGRDWSAVEPSILGTLFERSLNPQKRAQIGAHYTSRDDIMLIVEPVVLAPLRRQWEAVKAAADAGLAPSSANGERNAATKAVKAFASALASLRILDPACGSGNFLYVAIQCLLELEREVIRWAAERNVVIEPAVNPTQLHGIEVNDYAAELARISIWIGYLKWQRDNGIQDKRRPILDKLDTIQCRDAILKCDKSGKPIPHPAEWPAADFIIGNPPFLGSKLFRKWGLTDQYLDALYAAYDLPKTSDLCCYWFELARRAIVPSTTPAGKNTQKPAPAGAVGARPVRAGLLATQGIRGGDNRTVLERIKDTGDIFMAWSDREWTLDGAAVQVSMIAFDEGSQTARTLDGHPVATINADLTAQADTASAPALAENKGIASMGDTKGGAFDIDWTTAAAMLASPNPNARSNIDVLRPWVNGLDITRRRRGMWIIDYGCDMAREEAAQYAAPFAYLEKHVKKERAKNNRETYAKRWWIHVEPRPALRARIDGLSRSLGTPTLTKFRLFDWQSESAIPDHQLIVFARADDYFFGVLHSCVHEVWARRMGTQLREAESGFRYTPTTCFETFPLPWPPGREPVNPGTKHHAHWKAISEAAAALSRLRENWLNPPEWIAGIERAVDISFRQELFALPGDVRALVRCSAVMARAATDKKLKVRTLTNLYNERPAWLRHAHDALDRAVILAYAAVDPAGAWDPDWAAVYEPFGAGEIDIRRLPKPGEHRGPRERFDSPDVIDTKEAAAKARQLIDHRILADLLRLNAERSGKSASGRATEKAAARR